MENLKGMTIALVDNDFCSRENHNFPNLALMKISTYLKNNNNNVRLVGFDEINKQTLFHSEFDKIIISKAFTDSETPSFIYKMDNVIIGGTGFFYDKAIPLSHAIEHAMPDYNLYNDTFSGVKNTKYYTDFSIGYTTRGCFRGCSFCVNRNSKKVLLHSPVSEFHDHDKPKIVMLDDNVLGLPNRILFSVLDDFKMIGKPIQYKQGMDIRLMTRERAEKIIELKYEGDYYFAFDMIKNTELIENKLKIWHESYYKVKNTKSLRINTNLYVFCAYDYDNAYPVCFWKEDIINIFKRIAIIFKYGCLPFVMRHENYKKSPIKDIYIAITQWANQPANCAKYSFLEYAEVSKKISVLMFIQKNPDMKKYFDISIKKLAIR